MVELQTGKKNKYKNITYPLRTGSTCFKFDHLNRMRDCGLLLLIDVTGTDKS